MVGSVVSAPPHCFEIQSGCPKLLLRLGRGLASRRRPEAPARDRRNDGGIDGRRRLTGQSPTATAEPIDKGSQLERAARSGSPAIAALRLRIWRHQSRCTPWQVLGEVGSRMRRSRCGGAACQSVPREGWSALRGERWRVPSLSSRQGWPWTRSPRARPGSGSGPATPETLNNALAQRTAEPIGPG